VDLTTALEFIRHNHRAVVATRRADDGIQMTPVLAGVDGEGRVIISSTEPTAKVKNLRRDPRLWMCVLSDRFFGQSVQVEGTAEIISLPDAMEPLIDYYRRVAGEHPDWDDYRQAMGRERRVLIRIHVGRAGG
jgi:PPOX class probable F420-dependent enzyme